MIEEQNHHKTGTESQEPNQGGEGRFDFQAAVLAVPIAEPVEFVKIED